MAYLKIYQWEHDQYPEFQKQIIKDEDVVKYLRKLCRHFKADPILLRVGNKRKQSGSYFDVQSWNMLGATYYNNKISRGVYYDTSKDGVSKGIIRIAKNPSLGLVVHEFSHHLTAQIEGKGNHHNKLFKHSLKRSYTFAKRWLPEAVEN